MLINVKNLKGYKLKGIDQEVGSIKEFYFDDKFWTIRYLVANTGSWLSKRPVLISPYFLENLNPDNGVLIVNLTRKQIEDSPSPDSDKPVSRQFEERYYDYYGVPAYWGGPSMWGPVPNLVRDREQWKSMKTGGRSWDPSLRSTKDVSGHVIHATDGDIGKVDDFIIDDETWTIRYFVVDTKKWIPGRKVLVSPQWITNISWEDSRVFTDLSRDVIRNAPEYDPDEFLTRELETKLWDYYNRRGYWSDEAYVGEYSRHGDL